jgi:CBS domain-containing protein
MRRRSQGSSSKGPLAEGGLLDASCCVAEVMGTELFTLTPDTVVGSALRLAASKRIHHFLVIDEGSLTGIVCQEDLRHARQGALVGECMSSPVLCIGPETTVREAADIMHENSVGCLPVVTGAFLVGLITRDKLTRMGLSEEAELDEDGDPLTCAACGSDENVRRDVRAGMLGLCGNCAAVMPAVVEPIKGN